jgi:cell division protein FtsB
MRARRALLRITAWSTVSIVVALAAFAGLVAIGVLPVRTYFAQKHELAATQDRIEMLESRNRALQQRIALLRTDHEVARIARQQYGLVREGETLTVIAGLGDPTIGDGSQAVRAVPAAEPGVAPGVFETIIQALQFWRR